MSNTVQQKSLPGSFLQKKKVPVTLNPGKFPEIKSTFAGPLSDSTMVLVVNGSRTESLTIHHPIGITNLEKDDWVITPTSDIPSLLARVKDPNAQKVNQQVSLYLTALHVEEELLKHGPNGSLFYLTGKIRNDSIEIARRKAADSVSVKEGEKKTSVPDFINFLEPQDKECEEKIRAFNQKIDTKNRVQTYRKTVSLYQTCSGPFQERQQVACSTIPKGTSSNQVLDIALLKVISKDKPKE